VVKLLEESRGNVSIAAKRARITRRNFHRLLTRHKLDARQYRPNGSIATL
jgi:transcriptional regulator of acetoin/glycerol metabolism